LDRKVKYGRTKTCDESDNDTDEGPLAQVAAIEKTFYATPALSLRLYAVFTAGSFLDFD